MIRHHTTSNIFYDGLKSLPGHILELIPLIVIVCVIMNIPQFLSLFGELFAFFKSLLDLLSLKSQKETVEKEKKQDSQQCICESGSSDGRDEDGKRIPMQPPTSKVPNPQSAQHNQIQVPNTILNTEELHVQPSVSESSSSGQQNTTTQENIPELSTQSTDYTSSILGKANAIVYASILGIFSYNTKSKGI